MQYMKKHNSQDSENKFVSFLDQLKMIIKTVIQAL